MTTATPVADHAHARRITERTRSARLIRDSIGLLSSKWSVDVLLALGAMVALLRSWGVSMVGAALGGLSYAFAGPVVFQYANVIFLVGAAWMPLGLRAIDRWLRQRKRSGLIELAAVLSMQLLGGDLESAYQVGVAGAVY